MVSAQALFSRRKSTELLASTMQSVNKKIRKNTCKNQIRKIPSNYYSLMYCIFTDFFVYSVDIALKYLQDTINYSYLVQ